MDSDNLKKMFIGGLHPETTDESLINFYSQWGEVADAVVMRDSATKRSRGFGFITFKDAYSVDECMKARPHTVDGKQVDPKRATPKEDAHNPVARKQVKKVFVGGIKDVTENSDLMGYFSQFGPIVSADIVVDKQTGRKRGFAFITFEDSDAVDKCILVGNHALNGNPCEVKKAMERGSMPEGGPPSGGRGGRGGPRGGGGYAPYGGGPQGGYAGGYGAGGYGAPGSYPAPAAGYGAPSGAYGSSGYGAPPAGGYYGGYDYSSGAEFGSGYGSSNGGGAMKNGGYATRAAGPYSAGGSYGAPPAVGAYAGYNSSYGGGSGYGYGQS